jgi:hypothetical protein
VLLNNKPLAPSESVDEQLVVDEDGHGRATYGFKGGSQISRTDLNEGDTVFMGS